MENSNSGGSSHEGAPTSDRFLTPIALVIGALIIGGALYFGHGGAPSPSGTTGNGQTPAAPSVNIKDVKIAGDPYIGNKNAPVTMAFWSDYQCPYCKAFEVGDKPEIPIDPAMPEIIKNYVDTGKVKIVFLDFPFLGPDSQVDAEYARAVWALYPSKFFAWRSAFYTQEPKENSMDATQNLAFIKKVTDGISGMDFAKVQADVAANKAKYDAAISADKSEGQKFGINGTPSMIIGTHLLVGAQPYSAVSPVIDAELGNATK